MVKLGLIMTLFMTAGAFFLRIKEMQTPVSTKKILLPPVFMSTGAFMYFVPQFRLTGVEIMESIILGMLFSLLLIRTSKFTLKEGQIFLHRSKAFLFLLVFLVIARTGIKYFLSSQIDFGEISGMSFLIAFSMIVPWRLSMFIKYKKFEAKVSGNGDMIRAH